MSAKRTIGRMAVLFLLVTFAGGSGVNGGESGESPPRLVIESTSCDEGDKTIVEAEILKHARVAIIKKNPAYRMTITCRWQPSLPGSTPTHPNRGYIDFTAKIVDLEKESTVFAASASEEEESRGLAMRDAASRVVRSLVRAKVFPKR